MDGVSGCRWLVLCSVAKNQNRCPRAAGTGDQVFEGSATQVLTCVALATGLKCLPHSKHPDAHGAILHDSHAEILALRAFNRFLLDECRTLARPPEPGSTSPPPKSDWVRWRGSPGRLDERTEAGCMLDDDDDDDSFSPPFELQDDIGIHMFCSELPCGDASMELTMSEQLDATPWVSPAPHPPRPHPGSSPSLQSPDGAGEDEEEMLGRGHFDRLGIVRRKPSRPDAPLALSKSCSDKLALKQCTGILSSLMSLLVHPQRCYIDTLVVPKRGYSATGMERAFGVSGRMGPVLGQEVREKWTEWGFRARPFEVQTTEVEFELAKRVIGEGAVPSNLSAVYTSHRQEILCNGVLQGRKQFDLRGASCLSRREMWKDALGLVTLGEMPALAAAFDGGKSYSDLKACRFLSRREDVKVEVRSEALQGWKRNTGDEAWRLSNES